MWIVQSLGSAFFESAYNGCSHSVGNRWSIESIAWWQRFSAAVCIIVLSLLLTGAGPNMPDKAFWLPATGSILINAVTSLLYTRALRESLSQTVPITALSPVLLLVTVPILTGRSVPPLGMVGIGIIAVGLYVLKWEVLRELGWLGPLKSVWREKGPRLMLIVVCCWAVTAPLDRLAVEAWHPFWFAATLHGGIAVLLTPFWLRGRQRRFAPGEWRLAGLGPLTGVASMLQMMALTAAPVAFVIALRRFSAPLTSVWDRIFFTQTEHFRLRLIGALVMTCGGAVMLLSL